MNTTVPDLVYTAANMTGLLSGILSVASVVGTGYGVWTRRTGTLLDKCRDLLVIAKDARNVFLAFMAVFLLTVAPSVTVQEMSAPEALVKLTRTYCSFMIATLVGTFICSAIGVVKGSLSQTVKEHLGQARAHSLVLAVLGLLMTYAVSLAS